MKIKKSIPIILFAILVLSSLSGCKPVGPPARSSGSSLSGMDLPAEVAPATLIQVLQQNDFETVDGKTFEQAISLDPASGGSYVGVVALRDTTIQAPNKLIVGVGSDAVYLYESYNLTGNDNILDWQTHIKKRTDLVKKLAADKN